MMDKDEYIKMKKEQEKSSMIFFLDKLKGLDIPMPRTTIVPVDRFKLFKTLDKGKLPKPLLNKIKKIIKEEYGYPVFIRTDQASGKHFWNMSCYVEKEEELESHIIEVLQFNELADITGLNYKAILIREYIPMDSKFTAFIGKMPVNPERRYFIKDGKVICRHPYWIADAIRDPSTNKWEALLKEMNTETEEEVKLLTSYAEKISKKIKGYWSVDFCKAKDGTWYMIDMASGFCSWHPKCDMALHINSASHKNYL